MGQAEYDWAMRIGERRFGQLFIDLLSARTPAMIVADGLKPPDFVVDACMAADVPLILSPKHIMMLVMKHIPVLRKRYSILVSLLYMIFLLMYIMKCSRQEYMDGYL